MIYRMQMCIHEYQLDRVLHHPDLQSPAESDLKMSHSSEDRLAYAKMKSAIGFKDGHFYLPLLWCSGGQVTL